MPPPMTRRRFGISRRLTASLAPMICLPSNLKVGSSIVDEPVAMTMAFVASIVSVAALAVFTLDRLRAGDARGAAQAARRRWP